ncbi:oligopeptide ABC transporter permease [Mangrovibacillus cuniculi]|uniref:ABC transporter permease n=1 Tax=Mangrovibacillus cuniculi TaxID=2593652 RepID=A0A7S8HET1_9BACI|nr:oligopeptide ABC transporter permease [Mangrovibacillus cuniculi]QPC46073.1 ABC transporter permease [Mangrovibacillus cuniculi]
MSQQNETISKDLFKPAVMTGQDNERIEKPSLNYWQDAWLRLRKNTGAVVSLVIVILLTIMAFAGPYMSPHDSQTQNLAHSNLPPKIPGIENLGIFNGEMEVAGTVQNVYETKGVDAYYWFGTDGLGRDLFSRVWEGTQISLYIAIVAALIDMVIGVAYGGISAYYGGRVDNVLQRIIEVIVGIPNLVIVILMILLLDPGLTSIIIALTITGWVGMARVVRGQTLKLKNQEFVLAAKTLGAKDSTIIFKHLIPNLAGVILINTMFTIPSAIFFEAFLSFIGLGLPEENASLGSLVENGYKTLQFLPHLMVWPSVVISLIMITFNLLADGVRDALDPKMRD